MTKKKIDADVGGGELRPDGIEVEEDIMTMEALICTVEHPGFAEEGETINRLAGLVEERVRSLKRALGLTTAFGDR